MATADVTADATANTNMNPSSGTKTVAVPEVNYLQKLLQLTAGGARNTFSLNKTMEAEAAAQKSINRTEKLLIITIVLTILFKLIMVYVTFEQTIKTINGASYTKWPSGGFGTAICISYPAFSGLFGFVSSALPSAAYISFQMDAAFYKNPMVQNNPGQILDEMFAYAEENSNAGAEKIICNSWAGVSGGNVGECTASCQSGGYAPGIISSAFSTGLMASFAHGSFMGHGATGAAKGGGMLGFALIGAAIGAGTSAWSTQESNAAANAANPACNSTPKAT